MYKHFIANACNWCHMWNGSGQFNDIEMWTRKRFMAENGNETGANAKAKPGESLQLMLFQCIFTLFVIFL